jgi:hypothetical protein
MANPVDGPAGSERCVRDFGRHDDSTLFDRIMGESRASYTGQIVNRLDQGKVEATQQINVSKFWGGAGTAAWVQSQFEVDGKKYNAEQRGAHPVFSRDSGPPIDPDSAEYKTLLEAYQKVNMDFYKLPKCSITSDQSGK